MEKELLMKSLLLQIRHQDGRQYKTTAKKNERQYKSNERKDERRQRSKNSGIKSRPGTPEEGNESPDSFTIMKNSRSLKGLSSTRWADMKRR
jgi:hypothetical protein